MVSANTTPFEDLILGSQFIPILNQEVYCKGEKTISKSVGVLQCQHCKASFTQEQEALIHYKLHLFELHKSHFSVVVGDTCSNSQCSFSATNNDSFHFHCSHCTFVSEEILELPLHMEKSHLCVYKEVSLFLYGHNFQPSKTITCGECNTTITGTISTILHFLTHSGDKSDMNQVNNKLSDESDITEKENSCENGYHPAGNNIETKYPDTVIESEGENSEVQLRIIEEIPMENGSEQLKILLTKNNSPDICADSEAKDDNSADSEMKDVELNGNCEKSPSTEPSQAEKSTKLLMANPQLANLQGRVLIPLLINSMKDKDKSSELNPLMLLASLMEADQKSDCPLIPTQHFLLDEGDDRVEPQQDVDGDPSPESLLNGFREYKPGYNDAPGVFQCDQCPEGFKYQYQLTSHRKEFNHHAKKIVNSFPFKCHICGNEFTALADVKQHVWTHSDEYSCFCEVCGHAFLNVEQLEDHMSKHSSGSSDPEITKSSFERPSRCECCSVKFTNKAELTMHIVKYQGTCNPNRKSDGLKCATCGFAVNNLDELKKHRMSEHPKGSIGRRGFECDYCGKTFSCRSNLRDHLVVHTGEKPYPCDICGKTFSFVHNMKTHRLTHNEGRNEMCPYCDRAYKSKISLYYHMKKGNCRGLSSKEVPEGFHRCTECLQMFASEERYFQHKKKGHCQVSYRCEKCGIRCSTLIKLGRHKEKGCSKLNDSPRKADGTQRRVGQYKRSRDADNSEILCDRCNYGRDCCCTFNCKYCSKRVFSFDAYNLHRRKACPVRKQKIRENRLKQQMLAENKSSSTLSPPKASPIFNSSKNLPQVSQTLSPATKAKVSEEDSNSDSLTDLSTFISPQLLGTVKEA